MAVVKPNKPAAEKLPPWRTAKSLEVLRSQLNTAYPNRKKTSDGTIGDVRHQSSSSDHNAHVKDGKMGVVTALDITDDPGVIDSNDLVLALIAAKDPRIKYLISDGFIYSGSGQKHPAWQKRKYTGANGHFKHAHISVKASKQHYDSTAPWDLSALVNIVSKKPSIDAPAAPVKESVLRDKTTVARVQEDLWNLGFTEVGSRRANGTFDGLPGDMTETAILAFRNARGLPSSPDINKSLLAQIDKAKAEGWKRPLARARVETDEKAIVEKVEEAAQTSKIKTVAKNGTILSFGLAAADGIADNFVDAKSTIGQVQEYFASVPGWAWFLIACALGGIFWYRAKKAIEASKEAYQTGARR